MIEIPYYESSGFVFSNFSPHSVVINDVQYPTVEHAFHAQKFADPTLKERIRTCTSPLAAWEMARDLKSHRRDDWADIKLSIMKELLSARVTQHEEVKVALLATREEDIIEINPNDDFWGSGPEGNGQNQTGVILMSIRSNLQRSASIAA